MAGFTSYLEQKFLDLVFGGTAFPAPGNLFFGLHVGGSAPDMEAGTGIVEPVAMGYSRTQIANNATNFPAATQVGGEAEKKNGSNISFTQATGNWGTATHWFVADTGTVGSGNYLAIGALTTPKLINTGDTASFAPNSIVMTLD